MHFRYKRVSRKTHLNSRSIRDIEKIRNSVCCLNEIVISESVRQFT